MKKTTKDNKILKEKFDNVCSVIFSEVKHLELYIIILSEFEVKGNLNSELIKIIKNVFGLKIANIFSKITETPSRNSASIFYIKNFVDSCINNLSRNENEKNKLIQLSLDINSFDKKYKVDIKVFGDIKDTGISHNDLKLAKAYQEKRLKFDRGRMMEIADCLINMFKKFTNKDDFKQEFLNEIKNEVDLFCSK